MPARSFGGDSSGGVSVIAAWTGVKRGKYLSNYSVKCQNYSSLNNSKYCNEFLRAFIRALRGEPLTK